jgi:ABC-type amino acid transport substrate-binding protein
MKKFLAFTGIALSACLSAATAAHAGCLDDIKKAGVITSGSGAMGVKPAAWQNEDGSYAGYEWEIFKEIGKRIGVPKQDYVVTDWSTLIPGVKAKRWDIILSGMMVTQERIQGAGIIFSRPYFMIYDNVIVKNDSPIKSVDDLKGKTIGSVLGTMDSLNAHAFVEKGAAAKVLDFNNYGDPFVAMQNGQVDAVVIDQGTLNGQMQTMKDLRTIGEPIHYTPKPQWAAAEGEAPYILGAEAVGMRKECDDLQQAVNGALAAMEADGTRKAILQKFDSWSPVQDKLMK